ncbi:MAG: ABC transporter [Cenarchaeum symbiont of Oopsacas minuta]|nr:ABC transporter [Cenarchaeum symbiont of Oopsacas minuta]
MSKVVLDIQSVSKTYGKGNSKVYGINDVSLSLESGQFVLIVGSSGSGKSTLLNVMGMLDRPTSGTIFIDGIDYTKLDDNQVSTLRNKKIGFIFQFSNLLSDLTVMENVMLPRQISGNECKAHRDAFELLGAVGLKNQAYKQANAISGGQMQRVAIARGLINHPSIVLADEPTGNLDSVSSKDVVNLMKSIAKKLDCTFVIVTHDEEQFGKVDRVITINDGKIVKDTAILDSYGDNT